MASGGMSGIDIARQMGMTREEVETLVQANQKSGMIGR
jgi:biotin operon repressor